METSVANISKSFTKRLIEKRAAMLFKISQAYLLQSDLHSSDWEYGEAFRFAVLIHKGRKYFHKQWKEGSLEIDMAAVESIIERHSTHIDGPERLLPEEEETIRQHNAAAREWIAENRSLSGDGAPQTINMDRTGPSTYQASQY